VLKKFSRLLTGPGERAKRLPLVGQAAANREEPLDHPVVIGGTLFALVILAEPADLPLREDKASSLPRGLFRVFPASRRGSFSSHPSSARHTAAGKSEPARVGYLQARWRQKYGVAWKKK
jgi:hypothetical protein